MTYAYIQNDTIISVGGLPQAARRQDTGEWVLGLRDAPVDSQQACGYYEVADTPRPDDTATTTHDRSIELVAGVPTVVWTERAKSAEELDADVTETNRTTLEDRVRQALTDNSDYLAIAQPTAAQATAQVDRLTRQVSALIRLVVNELGDTG